MAAAIMHRGGTARAECGSPIWQVATSKVREGREPRLQCDELDELRHSLHELRHDHEGRRENGNNLGLMQIEVVNLRAKPGSEARVVDGLHSAAVDIPNASLPDVS
eukprot:CAMPEP_0174723230 /NCGR_PEP_ID=MMETSP1094-20130205/40416_1 /TAXON_ID=156173 /ORGANISM="Chrysochromulina brevifilum, Strain UTEX LB 985" /LENGTH=105 /DNA_ID=CAMNT_0015924239 /DNA_START=258 /DNA_END=575 /DNA_ORIENTATION=+